jgi:hypothetical protein
MARAAAREMIERKEQARRRELSGDVRATVAVNAPTIAVKQSALPPDAWGQTVWEWRSLAQPWDLPELVVTGTKREADLNGWTVGELLTRRLHRRVRNLLVATQTVDKIEANRVAKLCQVYVAESSMFKAGTA